jgi:hypothetical protein
MLKVRLNDKVVGLIKLDKTQKKYCFTICCLKSDELYFVNIFSVNNFGVLYSVDLLYYVKLY